MVHMLQGVGDGGDRLLIDVAAASEPLAEQEFQVWSSEQRVFISSVMDELRDERRAVADRLERLGCEPVLFERFGGREDDPEAAYLHEVATCATYVGILGRRYGRQLPSRYSATHAEYLAAERGGLRVAVWAKDIPDREGHEQSFLDEIRTFHTTGRFETTPELAEDVERRLRRIAAEDLAPWVKLGALVFRARKITEKAGRTEVSARLRSAEILAGLEAMRSDLSRGSQDLRLTYAGRVRRAGLEDLEVTTTAGRGAEIRLSLTTSEIASDTFADMSVSEGGKTYSSEDLTEMGLRHALFGEPISLGGLTHHMSEIDDPLRPVGELGLSEEMIRPIVHILLTDALVGRGRASRITRFRLGTAIAGQRHLELAWQAPVRYQNVDPEERQIEGVVSLARR
jgi:hypothetical protein